MFFSPTLTTYHHNDLEDQFHIQDSWTPWNTWKPSWNMALWRKLISSSFPVVTEQDEHSPSVQFSLVTQLCPKLCDAMHFSTSGFPVYHQLLELVQSHVHQVSDPIQPSHSLSSLSPLAFNLSQRQGLFQ